MPPAAGGASQRIDQWLWFARIAKSRTLAQALIERGKVRVNRIKIDKPATAVKPGDVLTLSLGPIVRTVEILGIGKRRGPASEASLLFREMTPPRLEAQAAAPSVRPGPAAARDEGAGRPTKRDRRLTDKLKGRYEPL
jgi:ribosome-associated heat shock protein Hsp15